MARRKTKRRGLSARRRSQSRLDELREHAKTGGLYVASYSPGDGVTRYRFFDKPGNDYFGPGSGVCTVLGIKKAWKYLQTGSCPTSRRRR